MSVKRDGFPDFFVAVHESLVGPSLPRRPRASVSVIGSLAAARLNARGGS